MSETSHEHAPPRDDLERWRSTVMRTRPVRAADLARASAVELGTARAALRDLTDAGFIGWDERYDYIDYRSPAERAVTVLREHVRQAAEAMEHAVEAFEDLPAQTADWAAGMHGSHDAFPVRVIGGPEPITALWQTSFQWTVPRRIRVVISAIEQFDHLMANAVQPDRFMSDHDVRCQCIVAASLVEDPRTRARLSDGIPPVVEVRCQREVDSWFMVYDNTLVVPRTWGQTEFSELIAAQDASLVDLGAAHFDRLWRSSAVMAPTSGSFEALLDLLASGMTAEAAARALGLSERTARRRIAEAMRHFDVDSLFGLGMRWQQATADPAVTGSD